MCLINFHLKDHPNYKLIVAANRDEFYERPTRPAHFWKDEPGLLAGRDLVQMGTWLGITKSGRFAALTNYRNPAEFGVVKESRGEIVKNFLVEDTSPSDFIHKLNTKKDLYNGFNILIGNTEQLHYYNNINEQIIVIPPGTHGLSNRFLNTPWPKVIKGKEMLQNYVTKNEIMDADELFNILMNAELAEDASLPKTGVELELERQLSPLFIQTPNYGTRCSTILLVDHDNNVTFIERTYENGQFKLENNYSFQIS
ncbi:NRDE family protein [Sporosarcina sp. Marseille-Q4063]|uniref:NRDE family protein n=1 Tax=Sporosarcina sp. Marseille-Q4063 TaxID=2810514 RepID=UPI001BAE830E|nr:NRDE family protein [Sporosarcina sp. Marseille-Q4063]QUW22423.1 NRDE family protein [Sporosarcina sp. Marseille-Q4063]